MKMEGILEPKGIVKCDANGLSYAGVHLLLEFWGAKNLDDISVVEEAFRRAVADCGATLLGMKFHHFSPYGGISGVAIVMESHLTIHSWPELGYAAIDIFLCGGVDPYKAIPALKEAFEPERTQIVELKRGIMNEVV